MAPDNNRNNVTQISEEDYQRLKREAVDAEDRANGMRVVIVSPEVYAAERRKIARRRIANKQARNQRKRR